MRDTVKRVLDGRIVETPERSGLWAAQTPQVFRRDWLEAATAAAARAGRRATDDSALVEAAGHPVAMVEAGFPNPKITKPEDLAFARVLLEARARARGQA
jgi:2-C-methyl-D-erythritol 4-phosphate cytidylyltransferase